jgi:chitinase
MAKHRNHICRSERRKCHDFPPSSIPVQALTHLNFAFAFLDADTYDVIPMDDETPRQLFQDVTDLKSQASALEVWIAIGGWTFSDNGTATQPLLGEIAADSAKRQKFADNLVDFMTKYGFDGVDIDW